MRTVVQREAGDRERRDSDPTPAADPMKTRYPTAAATNPGSITGITAAPSPTEPSIMKTPPTIGPPNSAEMAANAPAAPSVFSPCAPSVT